MPILGWCWPNLWLPKYTMVDGKTIRLMLESKFSVCITKADVVAFRCGRCYCHGFGSWYWQTCKYSGMADVICLVVDVKTTLCLLVWSVGWCYCQVADGITTRVEDWQMLQPSGRWNGHCSMLFLVLGCQTEPHPICVAEGTCQHFYSGMDH